MSEINLIATSTFGLEAIVAGELKKLGYDDCRVQNGRVDFTGEELAICRTNLWMRVADRILVKMGEFKALSFEELFQQTKALPWDEWLPVNAKFPVNGKSIKSKLFSVSDCQAIVKKAIVEKLKEKYKKKWFSEDGPQYTIEVGLLKDTATITLDTSGAGLHKRGYRKLAGKALLKETLAAGMILVSRWRHDRAFLDPLCGSGTIPIEAAMIGLNIAPGLKREFASEKWNRIPKKYWDAARQEARDYIERDRILRIQGTDIDKKAIGVARYHLKIAGLEDYIHFQERPVSELSSKHKYGYIVTNPPYGERLGEKEDAEKLYREMGEVFSTLDSWSYYIITSYPGFERLFTRKADKKRKLYNGKIQCQYYQYFGPRPPRKK